MFVVWFFVVFSVFSVFCFLSSSMFFFMILDDFDANVEKIESFLKHGGTPKQILSEQDLVKVINHVLVRAPAVLKSAKFDEFKDIVTSKMD